MLILIIDDSTFQRKTLKRLIQAIGHEAIEASNGKEGLEAVLQNNPDCICCDLLMPVMNGIEFLETLQSKQIEIDTIVISADIQDATKEKAFSLGAIEYLNKPVNPETLKAALDKVKPKEGAKFE